MWERRTYFFQLFSEHLLLSFVSVVAVAVVGMVLGWVVYRYTTARKIILPIINFLYTIPSIAMFGLLIPLVGIGLKNALIVIMLYGLLPIVRNTYSGLKEVPNNYIEAAKGLGANARQLFWGVHFPLALPSILSALRVTTVMVISLTGLAALIGAGGLGQAIFRGLNTMNTQLILVGSLGISFFAILGDFFVGSFEKNHRLQRILSHNATPHQKRMLWLNTGVSVALLLSAIVYLNPLSSKSSQTIVVASKPTTEQFILSEIIAQIIEDKTDLSVTRKFGIGGGTTNIHPAMQRGEIDLYVEYTGTAWRSVLEEPYQEGVPIVFDTLNQRYQSAFQVQWLGLIGFNNTYTLAIKKSTAQEKKIKTFSDLAQQSPNFTFGAEFDFFERPDAYKGLIKAYPFQFAKVKEMDINLRYEAIKEGSVSAIDAFTTDAQIESMQLQVLEDDRHYFPDYEAGIVIRQATAEQYPEVVEYLQQLNGQISTEQMRQLNYQIEIEGKSVAQVAHEFVQHLFKNSTNE